MIRERLGVNAVAEHGGPAPPSRPESSHGQARWSWEAYSRELHSPAQRIDAGRALVRAIEDAMAAEALVCAVRFRKGYVAVQRRGGYNVLVVDMHWKQPPRLAVKLPDDPDALGLTNPYPGLATSWTPAWREWGWAVPSTEQVPDVSRLIPIVRRFHYQEERVAAGDRAAGNGSPLE